MNNLDGDLTIKGKTYSRQGFEGPIDRSQLITESGVAFPLKLQDFRVWNAMQTLLPGVGSADDLGFTGGTFGTSCPYIYSADLNAAGTTLTGYARTTFQLPVEYVAGSALSINLSAGMLTAVASVSATADVEVYLSGRSTIKSGSDLIQTVATDINSLTFADKAFIVNPTGLVAGAILDIRVALIANSATATAHFAVIGAAEVLLDTKG